MGNCNFFPGLDDYNGRVQNVTTIPAVSWPQVRSTALQLMLLGIYDSTKPVVNKLSRAGPFGELIMACLPNVSGGKLQVASVDTPKPLTSLATKNMLLIFADPFPSKKLGDSQLPG